MKGRDRLTCLHLAAPLVCASVSLPAVADIDLVGRPTLYSTTDVDLDYDAWLTSLAISQNRFSAYSLQLEGTGTVDQGGQIDLLSGWLAVSNGNLAVSGASSISAGSTYVDAYLGNSTLSVSGNGTTFSTTGLSLSSQNGYEATFSVADGAIATVGDRTDISTGSTLVVDNAIFNAGDLINEGLIEVRGSQSQFNLNSTWFGFGRLHFSDGAVFSGDDTKYIVMDPNSGDEIIASGAGTLLNPELLDIYASSVVLEDGAAATVNYVNLNAFNADATLLMDGAGTQQFDDLTMDSSNGHTARFIMANGGGTSAAYIGFMGIHPGTEVLVENSILSVQLLENEGLIEIKGSQSQFLVEEVTSYFGWGQLKLSGGAVFSGDVYNQLWLNPTDQVTATGAGTLLNPDSLRIDDTTLVLEDGAAATAPGTSISAFREDATLLMDAAGTQNFDYLFLDSYNGYTARYQMINGGGSSASYINEMYIGTGSEVLVDNSILSIDRLVNEGLIEVKGSQGQLLIGDYPDEYGRIAFSDGASFSGNSFNELWLRSGDEISATGAGTLLNPDWLWLDSTTVIVEDGASAEAYNTSIFAGSGDAALLMDGASFQSPGAVYLDSSYGYTARLSLSNGGATPSNIFALSISAGSEVLVDNSILAVENLYNEGLIEVTGSQSEFAVNYRADRYGQIHLADGALFSGGPNGELWLGFGDEMTATGAGTHINAEYLWVDSTTLLLEDGASATSFIANLNAFNADATLLLDGAGTQTFSALYLDGYNGNTARFIMANGAGTTAAYIGNMVVDNGGEVLVDNSILSVDWLSNQGLIEVKGSQSQLLINKSSPQYGQMRFSGGAVFSGDSYREIRLQTGDHMTASGVGTLLNPDYFWVDSATVALEDGAEINTTFLNHSGIIEITGDNNRISALHMDNAGVLAIDGSLEFWGTMYMDDNATIEFTIASDNPGTAPMLTFNGDLMGNQANIAFDVLAGDIPASAFSLDLILFAGLIPTESFFNIDLSAFDSWGPEWQESVALVGNRLVLSVASAVPVPAAIWLFASACLGLVSVKRRSH